jgi:SAM-dependent methyltransferase
LLRRIAAFARTARGVDLSPEMLERASARGLDVIEASATRLPFADASFDVACSFKVLAHVRDVRGALSEMARVVRPGGHVLAELYNPISLRGLVKHIGPASAVSDGATERDVYTRFDTPWSIGELKPHDTSLVDSRGVRIVTPAAAVLRVPLLGGLLRASERALCDSSLRYFGGFWIAALRKA